MLWGNQILDKCAIIRIDNLFPKVIHLPEFNYGFNNMFMLLAREKGAYSLFKDIGHEMTDAEILRLKNTLDMWDNNAVAFKGNSIIQIKLPDPFQTFLTKINDIVGARVTPAFLILDGNMFIQIEFDASSNSEVSKNILKINETLENFVISVEYFGDQSIELSSILNLYLEKECDQYKIEVIKTKWMITERERFDENEGLFQNLGIIIPKYFGDENISKLVFRCKESEIRGNFDYRIINKEKKLFEITVKSSFMGDFYRNVIEQYYGAASIRVDVTESEVISYYLVEKHLLDKFYMGMERHWEEAVRENHKNYIQRVNTLKETLTSSENSL